MKRRVYCTEERCGRLFISQNFCVFSYDDDDFSLAQRKSLVVYALRHDRDTHTHTHPKKQPPPLDNTDRDARNNTNPKGGSFFEEHSLL